MFLMVLRVITFNCIKPLTLGGTLGSLLYLISGEGFILGVFLIIFLVSFTIMVLVIGLGNYFKIYFKISLIELLSFEIVYTTIFVNLLIILLYFKSNLGFLFILDGGVGFVLVLFEILFLVLIYG